MKKTIVLILFLFFGLSSMYAQDEDTREPKKPVITNRIDVNEYGELSKDDKESPSRANAHPRMAFKDIIKSFGREEADIMKQCERKARRKEGAVVEKKAGLNNYKRIHYSYTENGVYHEHIFYFRGGPFLDMYEYITNVGYQHNLIRDSYELSCRDKESATKKIAPVRHPHSVFDIPIVYTYRDDELHYFISFGAYHDPSEEGNDVFNILINREGGKSFLK